MLKPRCLLFQFWMFVFFSAHNQLSAAPEGKLGLYSETDDVIVLNMTNFFDRVLGKENAWVVEFYNSWCGHCIHFAPIWKKFATDIKDWRRVVSIGAVDCSQKENLDLCRIYGVNAFPTMKFIPPHAVANKTVGTMTGAASLSSLHPVILDYITDSQNYTAPVSWPRLQDLRKLDDIWEQAKSHHKFVLLIFEDKKSIIGQEVILDVMDDTQVLVRRMLKDNVAKFGISQFPTMFAINKDGTFKKLAVGTGGEADRRNFVGVIRSLIGSSVEKKLVTAKTPVATEGDGGGDGETTEGTLNFVAQGQSGKPHKLAVHMQDLESALHYCLRQEVAIKHSIDNAGLSALKNFLHVLAKYFPGRQNVRKFLSKVYGWLTTQNAAITGDQWLEKLELLQDDSAYLPETVIWTGCLGSKPGFRGYPCGMWMLFHTLTVSAYLSQKDGNPQEVLLAVRGYMDNFFGCDYCQKHFHKMAITIESEVTKPQDSVLWLWKGHNSANKRLHGDLSEDPSHPKVQFPGPDLCPPCLAPGSRPEDPQWNTWKVFKFLVNFYGQQRIVQDVESEANATSALESRGQLDWWEAKQAKADLDRVGKARRFRGRDGSLSPWRGLGLQKDSRLPGFMQPLLGLTGFDIGFCMMFYVLCALCIVAMYYHFIVRRRWRPRFILPY